MAAVLLAGFCSTIIFRKQWMENERLTFPIATAVLELTGVSGSEGTLSNLVRSRLFRIGFWSVLFLFFWTIATWFLPTIPLLEFPMASLSAKRILLGKGFPPFMFSIHPMTIAFSYFTKSEVLLSIWFFHLLAILQVGIFSRIGFDIGGSDPWCSFDPAIGWQSFGGMIVFVGWGLWTARTHLKEVFRKAFTGRGEVDDSDELLSYRMAVYLLLVSAIYLIIFLRRAGKAPGRWCPMWRG